MGINTSKCHNTGSSAYADASGSPFMATCSRIGLYEAELLVTTYNLTWYGRQPSSPRGQFDLSPPTSPLYDSDDEPMEPSGVVNALAVNSPPASRKYAEPSSRCLAKTLPMLRSFSDPLTTAHTEDSSIKFYPAAPQCQLQRAKSSNNHGNSSSHRSSSSRSHNSSSHSEPAAAPKLHTAANLLSAHTTHTAAGHAAHGVPLSTALVAAVAGVDNVTVQQLSLVSNQGSGVDQKLRPYHHLHMMQQRQKQLRQQQRLQQHAVAACAQVQTHVIKGWHVGPTGLAEVVV